MRQADFVVFGMLESTEDSKHHHHQLSLSFVGLLMSFKQAEVHVSRTMLVTCGIKTSVGE